MLQFQILGAAFHPVKFVAASQARSTPSPAITLVGMRTLSQINCRWPGLLAVVALPGLGGCVTRQNVGPLYDAAIANFQTAQQLETAAAKVEIEARIDQVEVLFVELDQLARDQIEVLLVNRWDPTAGDFLPDARDTSWRAVLGVAPGEQIEEADVTWAAGALAKHLSTPIWTAGGMTVTGLDVLRKPRGVAGFAAPLTPPDDLQSREDYAAWYRELRENFVGRMRAVHMIKDARDQMLASLKTESSRRHQHTIELYGALIDLSRSAKAYAGALTSNAQLIALANKLIGLANGKLQKTASAPLPTPGT